MAGNASVVPGLRGNRVAVRVCPGVRGARSAPFGLAKVWLGDGASSAPMGGVPGGGLPAQIWRAVMPDAARA